ncbi:MAG: response regulator [bacterium]|nr:response regulator [bacterium]
MRITLWKKAGLLLITFSLCLGMIVTYVAINAIKIAEHLIEVRDVTGPKYTLACNVESEFERVTQRFRGRGLIYDAAAIEDFTVDREEFDKLFADLIEVDNNENATILSVIEMQVADYFDAADIYCREYAEQAQSSPPPSQPFDLTQAEHLDEIREFINDNISVLVGEYLKTILEAMTMTHTLADVVLSRVIIGGFIYLLCIFPLLFLLMIRLIRPTKHLNMVAELLIDGHYHQDINLDDFPNDELRDLAGSLKTICKETLQRVTASRYASQVVGSMSDMLLLLDTNGLITVTNPALCNGLGYDCDELKGQPASILIPAASPGIFAEPDQLDDVLLGSREIKFRHKDGTKVTTTLTGEVVTNTRDMTVGFICVAHDISDVRLNALEKEMTSEISVLLLGGADIHRLCMEVAGVLSRRLNFTYSIIGLYQSGKRVLDLRGSVGIPFLPEELIEIPVDETAFQDVINNREAVIEAPFRDRVRNGVTLIEGVEVQTHISLPLMVGNQLIGVLTLAAQERRTISESTLTALQVIAQNVAQTISRLEIEDMLTMNVNVLKEKNRELEEAKRAATSSEKAKSAFMTVISHEIRTPLNGIINMADMLMKADPKPQQQEYLDLLRTSTTGLYQVINDIMDLSKIESSDLVLQNLPFDLRGLIAGVVDVNAGIAAEKGIELTSSVQTDIPNNLIGDPVRIRQILINLIDNAIRSTARGSVKILVSSAGMDGPYFMVRVAVEDSGAGLPEMGSLMTFGDKADDSPIPPRHSIKLSLSIAGYLVEMMGGKIEAISKEGQGTILFFTIKLSVAAGLMSEISSTPQSEADVDELEANILLVEDSVSCQKVAFEILRHMGCRVDVVDNGSDAVRMVGEKEYDIVLMDCLMAGMSGYDTTRMIRKMDGPSSRVPIIALTAKAMAGDREEAINAGMDDYISKPINADFLRATIRRWIFAGQSLEAT